MISIMKNKFLLLPCTLLVVGLMTISVSLEGSAQPKSPLQTIINEGKKNENPNPSIFIPNNNKTNTPPSGNSNQNEKNESGLDEKTKELFTKNTPEKSKSGENVYNMLKDTFYGNPEGGEGTDANQLISDEIGKSVEDRKIDASRKAEEELEQQIDAVYEAGLKLKEDIKKAEAERDGFNGAGLSPERAEAKYNELDVKCLELRSKYEILVLQLEELQAEYDKLIGE